MQGKNISLMRTLMMTVSSTYPISSKGQSRSLAPSSFWPWYSSSGCCQREGKLDLSFLRMLKLGMGRGQRGKRLPASLAIYKEAVPSRPGRLVRCESTMRTAWRPICVAFPRSHGDSSSGSRSCIPPGRLCDLSAERPQAHL